MAHASLKFIGHASHRRAAARGKHLNFDAVTLLKILLQLLTHLRAGGNRDRNFALSLCGVNSFVPLGLPRWLLRLRPELERKEHNHKSEREG